MITILDREVTNNSLKLTSTHFGKNFRLVSILLSLNYCNRSLSSWFFIRVGYGKYIPHRWGSGSLVANPPFHGDTTRALYRKYRRTPFWILENREHVGRSLSGVLRAKMVCPHSLYRALIPLLPSTSFHNSGSDMLRYVCHSYDLNIIPYQHQIVEEKSIKLLFVKNTA
jgi:hypothetical protein